MRFYLLLLLCLFALTAFAGDSLFVIKARGIADSFRIHTWKPVGAVSRVVYYLDADLKSGRELRRQLELSTTNGIAHTLFVGIGHSGDFHEKRRRDFIPGDSHPQSFQAAAFYSFLTRELIPLIEEKLGPGSLHRFLIGHSLGGLFGCYAAFRGQVFDTVYALSPSLWADHEVINKVLDTYAGKPPTIRLQIYCGSMEIFNKIKPAVNRFHTRVTNRYPGMHIGVKVFSLKWHNSAVRPELKEILDQLGHM